MRTLLRTGLSAAALVCAASACGSSPSTAPADASTGQDATAHDAAKAPAQDARNDAEPDARASDAPAVDAPRGARLDAGVDAPPDARLDAPPDARRDAPGDTAPDAPRDAPVDAAPDAPRDAQPDAGHCHATQGPADAPRKVVVSHPYDDASNASGAFEVFDLDAAGNLTEPGVHFKLGPTTDGVIAFTPDGVVGIVAEDDGTLGVFRFDANGAPVVVSASLAGSYYADSVVMDPSGERAYVIDDQTTGNGGGIYVVNIACDGTLTDEGLLASADLPAAIVPLANGKAVVAAKSFLGVPDIVDAGESDASHDAHLDGPGEVTGNDAVLVPWPAAGSVLAWANPFGDDLAIVSSGALTEDGRYVLLGDNSQFSGVPNRVGVVKVSADGITAAGVIPNVNDPESIVASPFDDTLLVTSAFGNAFFVLGPTAPAGDAGGAPFALLGQVAYTGEAPQLPGPAVMIGRGPLTGRVLVGEDIAIRQVQFGHASGLAGVTDLGATPAGNANDLSSITGAIGVQP